MNEAINTQTRELSTQIVYNYESSIVRIIETSNIIQRDIDRFDIETQGGQESFSEHLRQIIRLSENIIRVSVYDVYTQLCLASSVDEELGAWLGDSEDGSWFYDAINEPTVHVFSAPYVDAASEEYRVNVSRQIQFLNGARTGVLLIEISFQSFIELVDKSNLGDGGYIAIVDSNYNIVYTSQTAPEVVQEGVDLVREIILGSRSAVLSGYNMAVNVDTLSNTKWRICVFINIDELVAIERTFLMTTILVSGIVLVIGILLFALVSRAITRPMKQLELAMRKVEKSDYFRTEEVSISASSEVEALTRRFNQMMRKINELMNRVIDEQKAQRKSELKALQNQINPHFLYNTLDSILWLIEHEKNKEAAEMLVALARLFRIGISNDSAVIPLRDEIEHVRNYLLIQRIRYADAFDYEFDIEEAALDTQTLKLILQPLVENCIYHGLKNEIEKGKICISAHIEEDYLLMRVSDNGYGMRQEKIDALYRSFDNAVVSNSVGLKNVYQRVIIYYSGDAEMHIESTLDQGTVVTIKQKIYKD